MKKISFLLFAVVGLVVFNACSKQDEKDLELIKADLAAKKITTAKVDESGVHYIIDKVGTGDSPTLASRVEVTYKGMLLDSTVFDSTATGATIKFPLTQVIEGWQIAVPLLKKGGKGRFWIPSGLAYGSDELPGIPKNSVLIFEIGLVNFD